nr:hypothetical protein [Mycoplasmopsis bovis]
MSNKVINVSKVINKFEIKLVNADQDLKFRDINLPSIHRLGLEIAGIINNKRYSDNVICWGTKESLYFETLSKDDFVSLLRRILSVEPPLLILSKGVLENQYEIIKNVCNEFKVPLYISDKSTSKITSTIGTYLSDFYSEETQVHACLVSIQWYRRSDCRSIWYWKVRSYSWVNTKRTFIYSWWCSFGKAYWR